MGAELAGRVALVTGANHGIGAAVAVALAARGARVVLSYLRLAAAEHGESADYERARVGDAEPVLDTIETAGGSALAVEADLGDPTCIPGLFDRAEQEFGPVEILINNASSWRQDSFDTSTPDAVGRTGTPVTAQTLAHNLSVDAVAAGALIGEFARRHLARGGDWGRIVGLTSGSPRGFPGEVSYGAAKAAQENLTMSAATELAPYGVTANIVHPPVTDTGWITDSVRAFVRGSAEHTHIATPAEVGEVVAQLCGDAARLISGNRLTLR